MALEVHWRVGGCIATRAASDSVGFYILVAIGPHSPAGRFYSDVVGHLLPFTFDGLLLASILYSLPFAVQPFAAAFEQIDLVYAMNRKVWAVWPQK